MSIKRKGLSRRDIIEQIKNSEDNPKNNLKEKETLKHQVEDTENLLLMNEVLGMMSAGYFVFDYQTSDLTISPSLKEIFDSCLPGQKISVDILIENAHPEDRQFIHDLFINQKQIKKRGSGQFRIFQKTREYKEVRHFLVNYTYLTQDETNARLLAAVREITKDIKQQKELQRAFERADESDKIKTTFLLNISHNIRTPMNSILGFAELLSLTDPGPERRKEYIQVIKRQSKNLLQLIDDVAEIAKFESGKMTVTKTPCNLDLLLAEILKDVDSLRSDYNRNEIKLGILRSDITGVELFTDAGRLHQIFTNLINYSLKRTTHGYIQFGYQAPLDNKIDFIVKDTGPGIGKDEIKYVFERYSQIDKNDFNRYDDETSLGLTIAKSIVKLLGGRINMESDSDGNRFIFSLPYSTVPQTAALTANEPEIPSSLYRWNDKVVLIVEDEEVNGMFLEAIFHETQAQTLYAKNGLQALELCKSINKIDLILMDIRMPVMNGLKATQEIRKFNKTVPIIAQTALATDEDKHECMLAGCNDTIIKPIDIEELLRMTERYFTA